MLGADMLQLWITGPRPIFAISTHVVGLERTNTSFVHVSQAFKQVLDVQVHLFEANVLTISVITHQTPRFEASTLRPA